MEIRGDICASELWRGTHQRERKKGCEETRATSEAPPRVAYGEQSDTAAVGEDRKCSSRRMQQDLVQMAVALIVALVVAFRRSGDKRIQWVVIRGLVLQSIREEWNRNADGDDTIHRSVGKKDIVCLRNVPL